MMQPWQSETVAATCAVRADAALRLRRRLLDGGAILSARGSICDRLAVDLGALAKTLNALASHLVPSDHTALPNVNLPAVEVSAQLWSLSEVLDRCGLVVETSPSRFGLASSIPPAVEHGEPNAGPSSRKVDADSAELRRSWKAVQGYNEALHLHMKMVILLISLTSASLDRNTVNALREIHSDIRAVRFRLKQHSSGSLAVEESQEPCMEQVIENYCSATEAVLISLTRGTENSDSDSNDSSSAADAEIERDQERRFVSGFATKANEHFAAGNFAAAERFFTKFLEKAYQHGDWDVHEMFEARLQLAACLSAQMRFDSADEILRVIEHDGCTRRQRCQLLQHRAEIALLQSDYASAKRIAQQASVLARKEKDDVALHDSISLMVFLCYQTEEFEEAEVYQGMLPQGTGDTRLAGVLNTEQLASILRQMELNQEYESDDEAGSISPQLWSPSTEKEVVTDPSQVSSDRATFSNKVSDRNESFDEPRELSTPLPRQQEWRPLDETPSILSGHTRDVNAVVFSSDGSRVVSGSDDKSMNIWDIYSGEKLRSALAHGRIRSVACSPYGSKIALTYKERLMICGLKEFTPIDVELSRYPAWDLSFSPNDSDVAVCQGKEVHIVSSNTGKVVKKLLAARGATEELEFNAVCWLGPQMRVAAASRSGAIHVWDSISAIRTHLFDADIGVAKGYGIEVAVSSDGCWIAATRRSARKGIRIFSSDDEKEYCTLGDGQDGVTAYSALAFVANGRCLLTCSSGSPACIQTWGVDSRTCLQTVGVRYSMLRSLAVSPDGTRVACASGKSILLFEAEQKATDDETAERLPGIAQSPMDSPHRGGSHRSKRSAGSKFQLWSKRRGSK